MQLQECINFKLTSTQNVVFNYFRGKLAVLDVTPIQYALLKCLWTEDMQTPSQLAQTLRLDASSITGILDRLEKKTLVERVYSRQDRRSVQVHLLESGAALQKPIATPTPMCLPGSGRRTINACSPCWSLWRQT